MHILAPLAQASTWQLINTGLTATVSSGNNLTLAFVSSGLLPRLFDRQFQMPQLRIYLDLKYLAAISFK